MKKIKALIKKYFQNFAYFYQRLGYRIFIRMVFNISVGVLDGFGLAMFLPLLQMVDGTKTATATKTGNLGFITQGMQKLGLSLNLVNILLILSLFFILKGLASYGSGLYDIKLRTHFLKSMRIRLTMGVSQLDYKTFAAADVGRIQNTLTGEVSKIMYAYQYYFFIFQQLILVLVYMGFAFFVDANFALLICGGGILINLIYRSMYAVTKKTSASYTKGTNTYQGLIIQFVANFKYLKATGFLRPWTKRMINEILAIEDLNSKIGRLGVFLSSSREPLMIITVCMVILLYINILGGTLGPILVSLLFFYRALNALMFMQNSMNEFLSVSGSILNMQDFEKELDEKREFEGKRALSFFSYQIELRQAGFNYGEKPVLQDLDMVIPRNRTIAFVGESGSGKTTLVNILVGLMPLTKGNLLIDNINREELNITTYQRRIGYITQEPVIFNDTVFNNISFWAEPTAANKERCREALERASVLDYVEGLPEKENTILGNNGINLSGGQKQRISIARELYKDVDILVLDEATSALDSETERAIQQNIEKLKGHYTILIVAHRLSTVKNADNIILMNQGQIMGQGKFEELVQQSDRFRHMVELQEI